MPGPKRIVHQRLRASIPGDRTELLTSSVSLGNVVGCSCFRIMAMSWRKRSAHVRWRPSPSAAIVTQLVARARPPMRTVGTGLLAVKQCSLTRVEQVRPAHTRYASDVVTADGALATRGGGSAQLRLCALDREGSAAAIWPSRLMPCAEMPFRLGQVAAPAKAACRSPSRGPMKGASEARLATRPQTNRPMVRRPHRQQGFLQPLSPTLR